MTFIDTPPMKTYVANVNRIHRNFMRHITKGRNHFIKNVAICKSIIFCDWNINFLFAFKLLECLTICLIEKFYDSPTLTCFRMFFSALLPFIQTIDWVFGGIFSKKEGSEFTHCIIKLRMLLNLIMGSHCGTLLCKYVTTQSEKYLCRL